MNRLCNLMIAALIALSASAARAESWPAELGDAHSLSANVALSNDYVYRGQSQTGNGAAISGGFDYAYESGGLADFYVGTWASNIDFGGGIEIDFYGGFSGELGGSGITWDAGVLYYYYPGQPGGSKLDFVEGHFGLGYEFSEMAFGPAVDFTVHYSPDWQTGAGDGVYLDGNVGFTLPHDFALNFHAGYQMVEDNATWGTPDWFEWNVYLSKKVFNFLELAIGYHDTDLSKGQCFGGDNICDGRVVFTVSAEF
jgi:uncharacterized protein (TIGR02001 family)